MRLAKARSAIKEQRIADRIVGLRRALGFLEGDLVRPAGDEILKRVTAIERDRARDQRRLHRRQPQAVQRCRARACGGRRNRARLRIHHKVDGAILRREVGNQIRDPLAVPFDHFVAVEPAGASDDHAAAFGRDHAQRLDPILKALCAQFHLHALAHALPRGVKGFALFVFL